MNKIDHTFYFSAAKIAAAANKQVEFHTDKYEELHGEFGSIVDRLEWSDWSDLLQMIDGRLNPQVMHMNILTERNKAIGKLIDLVYKIKNEETIIAEYEQYANAYGTQGSVTYSLTVEQVAYFRLGE